MKKFVSGLIVGVIIALSITTFASGLNIITNPYPVKVDGQSVDVTGYNINGSTYLKLSDFVNFGLGVNFNKAKKEIEVTTAQQTQSTTEGGITVDQHEAIQQPATTTNNQTSGKDTKPPVVTGN